MGKYWNNKIFSGTIITSFYVLVSIVCEPIWPEMPRSSDQSTWLQYCQMALLDVKNAHVPSEHTEYFRIAARGTEIAQRTCVVSQESHSRQVQLV